MENKDNCLTKEKWENFYQDFFKNFNEEKVNKEIDDINKTILQIEKYYKPKKNESFLELGCGPAFCCYQMAKKEMKVSGMEISLNALKWAKKFFKKKGVKNYNFVFGDIQKMPFKDNTFDLIYGGGVIEHLENPRDVIKEIYRVLKPGGFVFNTVPFLNIGSLTYRQIWGNIPYFPIIKEIAKLVHVKILKSRHMRFGLEYSFTRRFLRKIHQEAGFEEFHIEKFQVDLEFIFIKNKFLKRIANYLGQNSIFFWPMIYVVAKK